MLRWVIRAAAANRYKNKVISESSRASSKSKDAVRSFNRAKREKDSVKKMEYMSEGLISLSEVTTKVWPASSRNFLNPSSPETQPSSSPGVKSIALGEGKDIPSGYLSNFGKSSLA